MICWIRRGDQELGRYRLVMVFERDMMSSLKGWYNHHDFGRAICFPASAGNPMRSVWPGEEKPRLHHMFLKKVLFRLCHKKLGVPCVRRSLKMRFSSLFRGISSMRLSSTISKRKVEDTVIYTRWNGWAILWMRPRGSQAAKSHNILGTNITKYLCGRTRGCHHGHLVKVPKGCFWRTRV